MSEKRLVSWEYDGRDKSGLPPDLTMTLRFSRACKLAWRGWVCTRQAGHTGRHAAGTGERIVAVWPDLGVML